MLNIDSSKSYFFSLDNSQKRDNKKIESKFDKMLDLNKKEKKQFERKKLAIKINC